MDLISIVALSLLLVPLVFFTSGAFRIALGLAFVLFFPGYTLVAVAFPRKRQLGGIERTSLSFGLSIVVVPLIGLALNFTSWGISLNAVLFSVLFFVVLMAGIAWYRRRQLPATERFQIQLRPLVSSFLGTLLTKYRWDRALTTLLLVSILTAFGILAYVISPPETGERFTEFSVTNLHGKTDNYPQQIRQGQESKVIVKVTNHENEYTQYRIEIAIDGESVGPTIPIALVGRESWEQVVSVVPTKVGANQKIEFLLYKGAGKEPYLSLYIWVNVTD